MAIPSTRFFLVARFDVINVARWLLIWVPALAVLLSLVGIGFLLWLYTSQNNIVTSAYQELAAQERTDGLLTPAELANMTHKACTLNSGISDIDSFFLPVSDTLSSGGWCGNYVRVFIIFAEQEGYSAHKFHIQSGGRSHTLAEVYYQGKWRIIDPFLNYVYLMPNGEMATYQDLRQDLSLVHDPTQGPVEDPRLQRIYRSYEPIFPAMYRDAPDFYPRLGRSPTYHNIFVALSYPLSLFYEGGRRPILPNWLDRPELLGVYFLALVALIAAVPLAVRLNNDLRRQN